MRALCRTRSSATRCLDLLGVPAAGAPLDGYQGRIWLLDDSRALKLTTSPDEAAAALAILGAPSPYPSLAQVDVVHWVPFGSRFSRDRMPYAVLREEMPAVAMPPGLRATWVRPGPLGAARDRARGAARLPGVDAGRARRPDARHLPRQPRQAAEEGHRPARPRRRRVARGPRLQGRGMDFEPLPCLAEPSPGHAR
jgi:hypothetical protein